MLCTPSGKPSGMRGGDVSVCAASAEYCPGQGVIRGRGRPDFFELTILDFLSSLRTNPMTDIVLISQRVLSELVS